MIWQILMLEKVILSAVLNQKMKKDGILFWTSSVATFDLSTVRIIFSKSVWKKHASAAILAPREIIRDTTFKQIWILCWYESLSTAGYWNIKVEEINTACEKWMNAGVLVK